MLHHLADGVAAARSRTGIHASLLLAGQMVLALVVIGALRPAVRRSSDKVGLAGAGRLVADLAANGIGTTRRRHARIVGTLFLLGGQTSGDGVSGHARLATADGVVVHHLALGIVAAGTSARILALLVNAGTVLGALRADHTLRLAAGRGTDVTLHTAAHRVAVGVLALAVRTAGRRLAGILRTAGDHLDERARAMRIAGVPIEAVAVGSMVQDTALSIDATGSRTRVLALVADAGSRSIAVIVLDTFRSAAAVRISEVFRQAGTGASSIALSANRIGSTWAGVAGIAGLLRG